MEIGSAIRLSPWLGFLPHSPLSKDHSASHSCFLMRNHTPKKVSFTGSLIKPVASTRPTALSATEIVAADLKAIKGYAEQIKGWFAVWNSPLRPFYDPDIILDYFLKRPHLLFFRIVEVSGVFGSILLQLEAQKLNALTRKRPEDGHPVSRLKGAELLKKALTRLGPTFVKVGQSLSTRPDLIGSDTAKILSDLQDNLPPFPTEQAINVIEKELGQPVNKIFSFVSDVPVAAASFGQVYRGQTVNGEEVAIKVQRPDLLYSVALDICILRLLLAFIRKAAKRRSDLKLYADEIGQGLFGELDYRVEAANSIEFQAAHSKLQFLLVPKIMRNLSTQRVLTMEWINGDRPKELLFIARGVAFNGCTVSEEEQIRAKNQLVSLVDKGVEAALVQLLDTGILHADPHPGNMLCTPDGGIVFLDFGLLCRMKKRHQLAMLGAIVHIVNADWKGLVKDLADMEVLQRDINRSRIQMELEDALGDSVPKGGVPDIKFSNVLGKILQIAVRYQFKMPPYFILVFRSIASLEGLAIAVDPDFKVFASIYPYVVRRLFTDDSIQTRKILFSLILNEKRQFRWARVVSFASLARQHSLKLAALQKTTELNEINESSSDLLVHCANLLVSRDGTVLRQLLLEVDMYALMDDFRSNEASPFRRRVVKILADVFYKWGKRFLESWMRTTLCDSEGYEATKAAPCCSTSLSKLEEKPVTDEFMTPMVIDCLLSQNRQLQILLGTIFDRLKRKPLLMIKTVWTTLILVFSATALASHRLCVAISEYLFDTDLQESLMSSPLCVS